MLQLGVAAGNDFEDSYVGFEQNIAEPFELFLRTCFTRALPREVVVDAPPQLDVRDCQGKAKPKAKNPKIPKTSAPTASSLPLAPLPSIPTPPPGTAPVTSTSTPTNNLDWDSAFGDNDNGFGDDFGDNDGERNSAAAGDDTYARNTAGGHLWPAGMTAPLSPRAAGILTTIERGGLPAAATMADADIDPLLHTEAASLPEPP
ncbi:hypothetical protein B0H16DRAFT_1737628, partial [Mycena metata]